MAIYCWFHNVANILLIGGADYFWIVKFSVILYQLKSVVGAASEKNKEIFL